MQQAPFRQIRLRQIPRRLHVARPASRCRPAASIPISSQQKRHYAWGEPGPDEPPPAPSTRRSAERYRIADYTPGALSRWREAEERGEPAETRIPAADIVHESELDPAAREQLREARRKEHEEGVAWVRQAEREKIISTAARLRQKKEHSSVLVKGFVSSLLEMPEIKADAKAQKKVTEAIRRLDEEVQHVDTLLGKLADLLDMTYPELMHMTRDYAEKT